MVGCISSCMYMPLQSLLPFPIHIFHNPAWQDFQRKLLQMVLNLQDLIYTFFFKTLQWFESNTPPVKTILLFWKFDLSPRLATCGGLFSHNANHWEQQLELPAITAVDKCTLSNDGQYVIVLSAFLIFSFWFVISLSGRNPITSSVASICKTIFGQLFMPLPFTTKPPD